MRFLYPASVQVKFRAWAIRMLRVTYGLGLGEALGPGAATQGEVDCRKDAGRWARPCWSVRWEWRWVDGSVRTGEANGGGTSTTSSNVSTWGLGDCHTDRRRKKAKAVAMTARHACSFCTSSHGVARGTTATARRAGHFAQTLFRQGRGKCKNEARRLPAGLQSQHNNKTCSCSHQMCSARGHVQHHTHPLLCTRHV